MSPNRLAHLRAHQKSEAQQLEAEMNEHVSKFNSRSIRQHGNKRTIGYVLKRTGPTPEELHWRIAVLIRDGHKCVFCSSTERLEADHIKPKALYPDLKYDVSNGRTLCHSCHVLTPTYGSKVKRIISVTT